MNLPTAAFCGSLDRLKEAAQYLRLEHVRIPRFNMLARFSSLSRDGDYSQPGPAKGACECSEVPLSALSNRRTKALLKQMVR